MKLLDQINSDSIMSVYTIFHCFNKKKNNCQPIEKKYFGECSILTILEYTVYSDELYTFTLFTVGIINHFQVQDLLKDFTEITFYRKKFALIGWLVV